MPPPYCYDYPRPAVTVDMVAFALDGDRLRVLLIRRGRDPFAGRWALPGGFLDMDEPPEAGARRELLEETGLELAGPVFPVGFFGAPGRDPRGRTISLVFGATLPPPLPPVAGADDAAEAAWLPPDRPEGGFAFDHEEIVGRALLLLRKAVREGEPAEGLGLLPETFKTAEVRALLRALGLPEGPASGWVTRLHRLGLVRSEGGRPIRYRRSDPIGGGSEPHPP